MDDVGRAIERLDALVRLSWAGPNRRTEAPASRGPMRRGGPSEETEGWRRPSSVRQFHHAPTPYDLRPWVRHGFGEGADRPRFPSAGAVYGLEVSAIALPEGGVHRISPGGSVHPVVMEGQALPDPGALFFHQLHGRCSVVVLDADLDAYASAYGVRGYRYLLLEAGHLGQELLRSASADGWRACPIGAFWDEGLKRALALTFTSRVPIYAIAVGRVEEDAQ